ncbi:hypothetical protein [Actinomadura parmotrematis]|uniref:Uncharacterized protein n=1 Tax=Actinomadura parmotrematis TaxID=2864039 RepID=A0ABS7FWZ4_9ACTN|nr:hypothetical protein [Actinomadura parmotrematis]MBW8484796.1 hypothetical protein [Actinomadura parmotrematis]
MDPVLRRLLDDRHVYTRDLERHPDLLDACPHRHVFVVATPRVLKIAPFSGALPALLKAVEHLEDRGWEPVAWSLEQSGNSGVMMRRGAAPPAG